MSVRATIQQQAAWQARKYGEWNERMPDGTGRDVNWLAPVTRQMYLNPSSVITGKVIEGLFRSEWDFPKDGTPQQQEAAAAACSWLRILREEVAEAFAAATPEALRAELIQIAAVAQNWAETIERRQS
jgi:hypothetical protein